MNFIFWITGIFILIYLAYPFALWMAAGRRGKKHLSGKAPESVSVILLTFNGGKNVAGKISFLLEELKLIPDGELIIIDDNSSDGTREIIEKFKNNEAIQVIQKDQQQGIPHSMNLGVNLAKNEILVFCDQRQQLLPGSLQRILAPLADPETGAVSGCISHVDKANCKSVGRVHENYIKSGESRIGGLMGVYGPLYAIRKNVYTPIPENIILDDLYLSLKILQNKKIVLVKNCAIIDERFSGLYDYKRARRYLRGLLQLITSKHLLQNLSSGKIMMLLLHKYLRLLIVGFLFLTFLTSGIMAASGNGYLVIFSLMTLLGLAVAFQMWFKFKSGFLDMVRINFYYLAAAVELFFRGLRNIKLVKTKKKKQPQDHRTMIKNLSPENPGQP